MRESESMSVSTARFANVAFSDGSLLHSFNQRFAKQQPISAPSDVRRYFITPQESGELCLMSCLLGNNRDIFFPKLSEQLDLTTFSDIAERYIKNLGYEPYHCSTEQEARDRSEELIITKRWPCYFFKSDTSGEKDFEEFFTDTEELDMDLFQNLGIIKNKANYDSSKLDSFLETIDELQRKVVWEKAPIIDLFNQTIPNFKHKETGKDLEGKM
jgi:FlaA1/EpsC-like NDP-sugar epimerase